MSKLKATVIVPTTKDRGLLLPYSIGSILNQTVQELEIFIIGDGVFEETRQVIYQLQAKDKRIKFFDHPKHERRGEIYRHQALHEARGTIVCYLCDRDLMLPNHVAVLYTLLQDYDFASTIHINVSPDKILSYNSSITYFGAANHPSAKRVERGVISLSNVGHTLAFYKQLPHGWRTTPNNQYTDVYMWRQFMAHPDCHAYSSTEPTILYFRRKNHPGWPTLMRLPEIKYWSQYIQRIEDIAHLKASALHTTMQELFELRKGRLSLYALRGLPQWILQKVKQRLFKQPPKINVEKID